MAKNQEGKGGQGIKHNQTHSSNAKMKLSRRNQYYKLLNAHKKSSRKVDIQKYAGTFTHCSITESTFTESTETQITISELYMTTCEYGLLSDHREFY